MFTKTYFHTCSFEELEVNVPPVLYLLLTQAPRGRKPILEQIGENSAVQKNAKEKDTVRNLKDLAHVIQTYINRFGREQKKNPEDVPNNTKHLCQQCLNAYTRKNWKVPALESAQALADLITQKILTKYDADCRIRNAAAEKLNIRSDGFGSRFPELLREPPIRDVKAAYPVVFYLKPQVNEWLAENVFLKDDVLNPEVLNVLISRYRSCMAPNISPDLLKLFVLDLKWLMEEKIRSYPFPVVDVTSENDATINVSQDDISQFDKLSNTAACLRGSLTVHKPKPGMDSTMIERMRIRNSCLCFFIIEWIESRLGEDCLQSLFPGVERQKRPRVLYQLLRKDHVYPSDAPYSESLTDRLRYSVSLPAGIAPADVLDCAADLPLFRYLLSDGISAKREDVVAELLKESLHIGKGKSFWIAPPLNERRNSLRKRIDDAFASGRFCHSRNSLLVVLGVIASYVSELKIKQEDHTIAFNPHTMASIQNEIQRELNAKKTEASSAALCSVLQDALDNLNIIWEELTASELNGLFTSTGKNRGYQFVLKYDRLYFEAVYTALKLNLKECSAKECAKTLKERIQKETEQFSAAGGKDAFEHLLPNRGSYDTILAFLFYCTGALDERMREDVIMSLCSFCRNSDPEFRPVADSCAAFLTYALVDDNINLTKPNYHTLLRALFGDRHHWFMSGVFNVLIQSPERRKFFADGLRKGLTANHIPYFMMYADPLRSELNMSDPAQVFLADADRIRRATFGRQENLGEDKISDLMMELETLADRFLNECWSFLQVDGRLDLHPLKNRRAYVYGGNLLGYAAANLLRLRSDLTVNSRLLQTVIYSDYLVRKIHPTYMNQRTDSPACPSSGQPAPPECLYCGGLRLVSQLNGAVSDPVPLPEAAVSDYLTWIKSDGVRYSMLMLRLLAHTKCESGSASADWFSKAQGICRDRKSENPKFLWYDHILSDRLGEFIDSPASLQ